MNSAEEQKEEHPSKSLENENLVEGTAAQKENHKSGENKSPNGKEPPPSQSTRHQQLDSLPIIVKQIPNAVRRRHKELLLTLLFQETDATVSGEGRRDFLHVVAEEEKTFPWLHQRFSGMEEKDDNGNAKITVQKRKGRPWEFEDASSTIGGETAASALDVIPYVLDEFTKSKDEAHQVGKKSKDRNQRAWKRHRRGRDPRTTVPPELPSKSIAEVEKTVAYNFWNSRFGKHALTEASVDRAKGRKSSGIDNPSYETISLVYNECSIAAITAWTLRPDTPFDLSQAEMTEKKRALDAKQYNQPAASPLFRRCSICCKFGHYDVQCDALASPEKLKALAKETRKQVILNNQLEQEQENGEKEDMQKKKDANGGESKNAEMDIVRTQFDRCDICGTGLLAKDFLRCDGCDRLLHIGCLKPSLQRIPEGEWLCSRCDTYTAGAKNPTVEIEVCEGFVIEQRQRPQPNKKRYPIDAGVGPSTTNDCFSSVVAFDEETERENPTLPVVSEVDAGSEEEPALSPGELCWAMRFDAPDGAPGKTDFWPAQVVSVSKETYKKLNDSRTGTRYICNLIGLFGVTRARTLKVLPFFPHYEELGYNRMLYGYCQASVEHSDLFRESLQAALSDAGIGSFAQGLIKSREMVSAKESSLPIQNTLPSENNIEVTWEDADVSEQDGFVIRSRPDPGSQGVSARPTTVIIGSIVLWYASNADNEAHSKYYVGAVQALNATNQKALVQVFPSWDKVVGELDSESLFISSMMVGASCWINISELHIVCSASNTGETRSKAGWCDLISKTLIEETCRYSENFVDEREVESRAKLIAGLGVNASIFGCAENSNTGCTAQSRDCDDIPTAAQVGVDCPKAAQDSPTKVAIVDPKPLVKDTLGADKTSVTKLKIDGGVPIVIDASLTLSSSASATKADSSAVKDSSGPPDIEQGGSLQRLQEEQAAPVVEARSVEARSNSAIPSSSRQSNSALCNSSQTVQEKHDSLATQVGIDNSDQGSKRPRDNEQSDSSPTLEDKRGVSVTDSGINKSGQTAKQQSDSEQGDSSPVEKDKNVAPNAKLGTNSASADQGSQQGSDSERADMSRNDDQEGAAPTAMVGITSGVAIADGAPNSELGPKERRAVHIAAELGTKSGVDGSNGLTVGERNDSRPGVKYTPINDSSNPNASTTGQTGVHSERKQQSSAKVKSRDDSNDANSDLDTADEESLSDDESLGEDSNDDDFFLQDSESDDEELEVEDDDEDADEEEMEKESVEEDEDDGPAPVHKLGEEHGIYEVEAILDDRVRRNKDEYLVKWKGFPVEESTWEPERNILTTLTVRKYKVATLLNKLKKTSFVKVPNSVSANVVRALELGEKQLSRCLEHEQHDTEIRMCPFCRRDFKGSTPITSHIQVHKAERNFTLIRQAARLAEKSWYVDKMDS